MPPTIFSSTDLLKLSYGAIKCSTIAFHVKWVHEHLYNFKYYISNFHIKITKVHFCKITLDKSHFGVTCVTYVRLRIWYTSFTSIDFYMIGCLTKIQCSPGRIGASWRLWAHAKLNKTYFKSWIWSLVNTQTCCTNWVYITKTSKCISHNNEFCWRTHIAPPPAGPIALNNEAKLIESPLAAPLLSWAWINK